ncbi:MAG TPA: thiamine pyrophosphate-binding protein, partial [Propylenella sp.]|nr:thiamine pyrophosphate-binding protein [Propylenella sp.]
MGGSAKTSNSRTAAQALVEALVSYGAERVFCVPGESYLAVLDALYDRRDAVATIACRQEGGAAMMAEADGKLTGRPGICMVTRGPGATNASAGLHVAFQDSTPMILFVGQVGRDFRDREAFQEIDYRRMFGEVAKWVAEVDDPERIPEYVARAFAVAISGRPGPVVLALPEDMLTAECAAAVPPRHAEFEIFPSAGQMHALREALANAAKPLVVVGGSRWNEAACRRVQAFAEANDLPVIATFRRQDRFDNGHPCYCGEIGVAPNPKLRARVQESDLLIVLGARLGEMTTGGYTLLDAPMPRQSMIHIHAGAEELGRVYQPELAINATPRGFAPLLDSLEPIADPRWREWRQAARADYEEWQKPRQVPGALQMAEIAVWLRDNLPVDAVVANGAGNFATWMHRYHRYRRLGTQLAPISGSMGYGFPAAVAAKLRHRDRIVLCVAGDGDFLMTGQELATAVQYGAAIIVVIIDNGMYGTIRMHQEREYPTRTHATDLKNPDFVALGRAYGAYAEKVERTEEFAPAFKRASGAGVPALL